MCMVCRRATGGILLVPFLRASLAFCANEGFATLRVRIFRRDCEYFVVVFFRIFEINHYPPRVCFLKTIWKILVG